MVISNNNCWRGIEIKKLKERIDHHKTKSLRCNGYKVLGEKNISKCKNVIPSKQPSSEDDFVHVWNNATVFNNSMNYQFIKLFVKNH